jgi:hypothetical protein
MRIDSLVRGHVGSTERITTARVYRVSPWGWVGGIEEDGRQTIIYDPEEIEPPRPMNQRNDIPERLR